MRARQNCSQKLCLILGLWRVERERKCWDEVPWQGGFQSMKQRRLSAMRVTAAGAFNITFPMPIASWWGGQYVETDLGIITNPRAAAGGTRGLDFQSGQSHEDLRYPLPAPSSAGSAPPGPLQTCTPLQSSAPSCPEAGAPGCTELISPFLQQQPAFFCTRGSSSHQLGISQHSAWPRGMGLPPGRKGTHAPTRREQLGCLAALLPPPQHPALHRAAGPVRPTPKELYSTSYLQQGSRVWDPALWSPVC